MLGGSLATETCRVLRLRMEGSREYTEINIRGQPTKGGTLAWGLGVGLTIPHRETESTWYCGHCLAYCTSPG
jgi:hypothetical protein